MPTLQDNTQVLSQFPLVSFIVTTYNLPYDMLRECLQSIVDLSLAEAEYEIILVDDGSDISPQERLRADLTHSFIYIWQENAGPAAARNTGLQAAQGRYVQFIDGDDALITPLYLHCLDFLKRENPDTLVFRHTATTLAPAQVGAKPTFSAPTTGSRYMETHNLRVAVWGYVFRRESLGSLRLNTVYRSEEDEEFTPQIFLLMERVYETTATPYFYRCRADSLTGDRRQHRLDRRLENLETILFNLARLIPTLQPEQQCAMKRRTAQLTADLLYNTLRFTHSRRRLHAAKHRLRAAGLYPLPPAAYGWKYTVFRYLIRML